MAVKHITDDEIQACLDQSRSGKTVSSTIKEHIESCRSCRRKYRQYQQLYGLLQVDEDYALSPDFADSVLAQVTTGGRKKNKQHSILNVFLVCAGIMALFGITVYFVNLKLLASIMMEPFIPLETSLTQLFTDIKTLLLHDKTNMTIYLFTGLILIIVSFADRILPLKRKYI